MSVFRSYFSKNNTLIQGNLTNNSQNPVTEISYGTPKKYVTRFLFDIDLNNLRNKIAVGLINPNKIVRHVLHMTNSIAYSPQYIGNKSYSQNINRAASFNLELFNITEDWQEGNGYDFIYPEGQITIDNQFYPLGKAQASNWKERSTGINWSTEGAFISGVSQIIGSQIFEVGNENIDIDITEYVNQRLMGSGYTGMPAYTGNSFGLGIKFSEIYENMLTEFREAVAFHTKHTNSFYEPYIETIIDDVITDDRNYFYMDKDNDLYLYVNVGNFPQNIVINKVDIYDYEDNLVTTISGSSVTNVSKGVYSINYNVSSADYPDSVLFRDVWNFTINSRNVEFEDEFYIIPSDKYYTFNLSNQIDPRNYFFNFWGISEKEKIRAGVVRKIRLSIKELYSNQNEFLPLDVEYRLFTMVGGKNSIEIIPFTSVNRTVNGYEFNLDTSWLIPQDYYLQIRLRNGEFYENKELLSFSIISDSPIK